MSEAASNIILHGLQEHSGELIELALNVEIRQVPASRSLYPGCGFEPQAVPPRIFPVVRRVVTGST